MQRQQQCCASFFGKMRPFCSVFDKNTKNCLEIFSYKFHKNIGLQEKLWYISNDIGFLPECFWAFR